MTDNAAIEAMARAIMIARPNGGCIVSDWQKEAVDNPHVSTALAQARAAYDALAAAGLAVVPVEPTEAMADAGVKAFVEGGGVYRAMIAAAKGE